MTGCRQRLNLSAERFDLTGHVEELILSVGLNLLKQLENVHITFILMVGDNDHGTMRMMTLATEA